MNELPTPRYHIGETVWSWYTKQERKRLPCPDCLDTKKWTVKTPAGEAFEVPCQRCSLPYSRPAGYPEVPVFSVVVEQRTIGSVRIDTASQREPVEYMCRETGIGSGTVYPEAHLYPDEESARKAAETEAALKTAEKHALPAMKAHLEHTALQFTAAGIAAAEAKAREVQYALDDLGDRLTSAVYIRNLDRDETQREILREVFKDRRGALESLTDHWDRPVREDEGEEAEAA
jgi:hypothetical protein